MEHIEEKQSRLDNLEFINKFIDVFADELEKIVTEPESTFSENDLKIVNEFRETKKLPRDHRIFHDLIVRVGQDFRLTPDEIDTLRNRFLE